MKYFFLRHGQASWDAPSDAARELTPHGQQSVEAVITANLAQLNAVELIVHSPFTRARQSAYIAGKALGVKQYIEDIHWLPNKSVPEAFNALETYANTSILVVGHNPLLSDLVGQFCYGPHQVEPFDTATLVGVEAEWPAVGMGHLVCKS